jgi:hypothetical protein
VGLLAAPTPPSAAGPAPAEAGFAVRYKGLEARHRVGAVFVLPGHTLALQVADPRVPGFELRAAQGAMAPQGRGAWRWEAPAAPGLYPLHVVHEPTRDSITLNVFVLVPAIAQRGEFLNGYRIGRYPAAPLRGLAAYRRPVGSSR